MNMMDEIMQASQEQITENRFEYIAYLLECLAGKQGTIDALSAQLKEAWAKSKQTGIQSQLEYVMKHDVAAQAAIWAYINNANEDPQVNDLMGWMIRLEDQQAKGTKGEFPI
ncbi:hypothetical protein [Paenibacillus amylolyticus]|uniref:Uncharacterized protein n=1 Tax=Paenibacillus amylolyticus TaxID=1451 RepID=A0ABD8B359_PAEAM